MIKYGPLSIANILSTYKRQLNSQALIKTGNKTHLNTEGSLTTHCLNIYGASNQYMMRATMDMGGKAK
jgi:hypothetical protein